VIAFTVDVLLLWYDYDCVFVWERR